mgnify:FL=1|jgi:hypothetical protein|tara:strand:+ start:16008 stop:16841 length:834 start_codon:yes stop_codon:yes gene_type:complete
MTEEIPIINEVHTACLDCVFSIKDKQKQIGCKFNRLELYEKAGAEIIKAYDAHNNEFDVINMRICMYKRGEEWAKEVPKHEQEDTVNKELRAKYHSMVYFTDNLPNKDEALKGLDKTLDSLDKQKNPPRVVTVISKRKDISQKILVNHITTSCYKNIEWRLQTFFDEEMADRECVDMVIDGTKYQYPILFYINFHSGFVVPESMSEELQNFFVKDMKRAVYAYPTTDGNGELVNSVLHLKHAGNCFNIPILEKIKEFEEGALDFIVEIEDICPSLKR